MDLVAINAYGRPVVQPSAAQPVTLGIREASDPREAQIPASPLAARNSADLRQSVGPRQSSSSDSTREDDDERGTVHSRGRGGGTATASRSRSNTAAGEDGERGATVDVTV